ncbi:MAG: cobalamin-dependent protein [Cypionkella sp.]|nr:cobalamin-dependent protein [Cypionkella sp.]
MTRSRLPDMDDPELARVTDTGLPFETALNASQVQLLAQEVILRVAAQARELRAEARLASVARVEHLAEALLAPAPDDTAAGLVRDARLAGMAADTLYHGLLAGAVKTIGQAWSRGEVALPDVMRASGRVWRIMRDLRDVFVEITARKPGQRAVLALCPGECHTIGLTMTADDLRRRGWEIELLMGYDDEGLIERLEESLPTTVAIAATNDDLALPLARTIVAIRAHLPGVWVLLGGQIVVSVPDILNISGADAMANSADDAERAMLDHFAELEARRTNRL